MANALAHLVQVEVGGVQSYIFNGSRLRGWRGASALLDRAERLKIPEVLRNQYGGAVRTLRQGGGVVLLGVQGGGPDPEEVAETVEDTYKEHAPGARVYSASVPFDGGDVSASLAALTFEATDARNRAPQTDPDVPLLGAMTRPCGSCGTRPAETDSEIADDGTLLCSVCARKATHGRRVRGGQEEGSVLARFAAHLEATDAPSVSVDALADCVPADLNAVAEAGNGSVALIQADGNSLGKTIQQIQTRDQYEALSGGLAEAVQKAVFNTLAEHGPRPPRGASAGTLPWEIIFLGGDDMLLATADDIALEVAQGLTRRIEARTGELFGQPPLDALGRSRLTMGTGVVVADPHVPMAVLRRLAHSLERSAKDRTYHLIEAEGREVSTLDFHRVTGSGSASLSHIRDHVLRPRHTAAGYEASLTQRPFTIDELETVVDVAQQWRAGQVPGNKLQALRESLFASPAQAMRQWTHVVARAPKGRRDTWQALEALTDPGGKHAPSGASVKMPFVEHGPSASRGSSRPGQTPRATTPLLDVLDVYALLSN
jgi:hypothetical protein